MDPSGEDAGGGGGGGAAGGGLGAGERAAAGCVLPTTGLSDALQVMLQPPLWRNRKVEPARRSPIRHARAVVPAWTWADAKPTRDATVHPAAARIGLSRFQACQMRAGWR